MLIDTHCHLDAAEFALDRATEVEASIQQGVHAIIVPAVCADNFQTVIDLAQQYTQCWYALGWHPMYIDRAQPSDMHALRQLIAQQLQGPNKLLALGEIGLDYFVTKQNVETLARHLEECLIHHTPHTATTTTTTSNHSHHHGEAPMEQLMWSSVCFRLQKELTLLAGNSVPTKMLLFTHADKYVHYHRDKLRRGGKPVGAPVGTTTAPLLLDRAVLDLLRHNDVHLVWINTGPREVLSAMCM
ncbi:MAG: hypothetical protein B7Y32_03875 [Methylophilales bacterium 16-45-7]|nr:MAG: hypothetical protein B7Y32_03875 [Methylophilales bacterium 16-45-7]